MAPWQPDAVDTSTFDITWIGPKPEPPQPYQPAPGMCPSDLHGRGCTKPAGHPPSHNDGHGTSWWPVSCDRCGGNYENGVPDLVEVKPHRYRCASDAGCRSRQRRARLQKGRS